MVDHVVAAIAGQVFNGGQFVDDIGRSLREAFFMFWETLWPLVLGFGLSGAVQAFVSPRDMERSLGGHGPRAVAKASGFGMVSSSCSYAAAAMAKSLFKKGADFLSALVFMFASTNLVIELGIVLAVLIGWQFTAAEFAGGPIMIVFLVVLGGLVLRPALISAAHHRVSSATAAGDHEHHHGGPAHGNSTGGDSSWRRQLRSRAAWSDAAGYTMADLKMLRREMVIGFLVAGFLAVLVPDHVWSTLFIHGHGVWTSVENALVGPVIAFLSFVCSIGNVPMAAALWKGGISFGGVISFLFADLVAAPLVLIYRRYYGGALAWRLVALFWVVMAGAGLIVGAIFSAAGLVPQYRPTQIVTTHFSWGYTAILNIIFIGVFAVLYWLYRTRGRYEAPMGYATDPVCGMQVPVGTSVQRATADHGGTLWFCSEQCAGTFDAGAGGEHGLPVDSPPPAGSRP